MIAVRLVRGGSVVREAVYSRLPVTLGRGAENDFVIFDPSVSRSHARIEKDEEGRLVLRDLSSRNGILLARARVDVAMVSGRLSCLLGHVDVEVETLSEEVTEEVPALGRRRSDRRRHAVQDLGYILAGVLGVLAIRVTAPSFWSPWEKDRVVSLLQVALVSVLVLPLLSFFLFGILRAVGRSIHLADTLRAAALSVWVLYLIADPAGFITYYLLPVEAHAFLQQLIVGGVVVALLVFLLGVGRGGAMVPFRLAWGLALACFWLAAAWASREKGKPETHYTLRPPFGGLMGPSRGLDAHLDRVRRATEAASQAAEAVRLKEDAN